MISRLWQVVNSWMGFQQHKVPPLAPYKPQKERFLVISERPTTAPEAQQMRDESQKEKLSAAN